MPAILFELFGEENEYIYDHYINKVNTLTELHQYDSAFYYINKAVEDTTDMTYLLQTEIAPYRFGLDGNQIYLSYRVHISDIFSDYSEDVKTNLTHLAFKADDLDNYLVDTFGCEFSEYANKNAI